MLSIENSKIEASLLVLLARFSSDLIQNRLIPEIEQKSFGICKS